MKRRRGASPIVLVRFDHRSGECVQPGNRNGERGRPTSSSD